LDQVRANKLLQHRDPPIRERAQKLLAASLPADRTKVLAEYQSALALAADPRRGKEVFRKNCSTCHKVGDVGTDVGPSIADSRTKTPAQMLVDILQPSRAIDNNFISYTIITADGQTLTGIIVSETAGSVTIKMPEGKSVSLLRGDIDELHSNGISLMPEGLERTVPQQDMADVIAYIKNWRYLDGQVPTKGAGVNLTPTK
jgi:putative heme-binding domain-containing protein